MSSDPQLLGCSDRRLPGFSGFSGFFTPESWRNIPDSQEGVEPQPSQAFLYDTWPLPSQGVGPLPEALEPPPTQESPVAMSQAEAAEAPQHHRLTPIPAPYWLPTLSATTLKDILKERGHATARNKTMNIERIMGIYFPGKAIGDIDAVAMDYADGAAKFSAAEEEEERNVAEVEIKEPEPKPGTVEDESELWNEMRNRLEDLLEPAPTQEPPPTQPTWSPPSHSSQQAAQAAHRSNCGASDQSDDGSEGDVGLRVFSPNTSRKAGAAPALMRERLDLPPLPTRPTRTPPNSPRSPPQKRHHGQDD